MNGQDRPPGRTRPSGSAIDIRALLTHREYIKTTAYVLPRRTKIQVLEMMERLRQERVHRRKGASARPDPLPEMTGAELVREINWRIGTLPPKDAEAIAGYIRRLTRWRAARTRKGGGRGGPSAPAAREASR